MLIEALLLLGLAALAAWSGLRWPLAAAVAVPLAAWVGTTLPDLDLILGLGHRSGLTHSLLPAALACWRRWWWPIAAGIAFGVGLHLSADIFPNAMRGFALVRLPGTGSLGADGSYWWLGANALASLVLGALLLGQVATPRVAAAVLACVAVIGIAYLFVTDGGWPALALYGGTGWLAWRGSLGRDRGRTVVERMR